MSKNGLSKTNFRVRHTLYRSGQRRHPALAEEWLKSDPAHSAYVKNWVKAHESLIPENQTPAEVAILFFQNFSKENPGKFPTPSDIPSIFFDMWRQDHPHALLQNIPGDFVTTSASGLDPHITLQNAEYQLDRVANKWAEDLKRNPAEIKTEIQKIIYNNARAPLHGLVGEKLVNVLEINLILRNRYGAP